MSPYSRARKIKSLAIYFVIIGLIPAHPGYANTKDSNFQPQYKLKKSTCKIVLKRRGNEFLYLYEYIMFFIFPYANIISLYTAGLYTIFILDIAC